MPLSFNTATAHIEQLQSIISIVLKLCGTCFTIQTMAKVSSISRQYKVTSHPMKFTFEFFARSLAMSDNVNDNQLEMHEVS